MQHFGKTSCTASTNSSMNEYSSSVGGRVLAQTQVERVPQVLLVVGPGVEIHRQQPLRRAAGRCGVELQLADRYPHAVGAQVTQAQDAPAVGDADEPHVFDRPITQHLFDMPASVARQVHAAWT